MSTLRAAVVGCGQIADAHLQAARSSGLATVVAVCDRYPDLARQAALRFGVPFWESDFDRMLDSTRPDVVHICTPPATHHALLDRVLDAGAHAYVEKPFAMSPAEARQMLSNAAATGRVVCAGHDRLFDPAWLDCRARIRSGTIGTVKHIEFFQAYDLDGPFGRVFANDRSHWVWQLPGGLLYNAIPHAIAALTALIPDERPAVTTMPWHRSLQHSATELQVLVRGTLTSATLTFVTGTRPAGSYVRVHGDAGWLEVDFEARSTRLRASSDLPGLVGRIHLPWTSTRESARMLARNLVRLLRGDLTYFAGLQHLVRLFYEAVISGGPSPVEASDVYRTCVLLDDVISGLDGPHDLDRCDVVVPA
jgi:predicted dehydrogenase